MPPLRDALRDLPDGVFGDLLEADDSYLLVIDLPGVDAGTVDVSVERGRLFVEARRAKDVPREFRYVEENRALFLDFDIPLLLPDATGAGAEATMKRGVLEVRLPKREAAPERSIPVEDADV